MLPIADSGRWWAAFLFGVMLALLVLIAAWLLRLIEPAFTGALVRAAGGAVGIAADGSPILKLSVREFEIARMISDDLSDKEIAHRLQVEVSTVRTHIERIFAKLGVRRRSGVASLFARH